MKEIVDGTLRPNLLYDFYGELLTERQKRFFQLYYQCDLSLAEVAKECGVTRQAVYDTLRRTCSFLEEMERKLGLLAKHQNRKRLGRYVLSEIQCLKEGIGDQQPQQQRTLDHLEKLVNELISDG